jgi:glycerol-3-phosphate dehydrogenase
VIVGGGGTGGALAYDLALRGFQVVLFERGELTSGTTGRHHGQLHSGARYAVKDVNIARECREEAEILRRIVPNSIEYNEGLFIALTDEDLEYLPRFLAGCAAAGIPAEELSPAEALAREPGINPALKTAVQVPDGTIDAFRLAMSFFAAAKKLGARIRPFHPVTGIDIAGGTATAVRGTDLVSGKAFLEPADIVVNAGGAWAGRIAALTGARVDVIPCPGTLLAVKGRLTKMVISRLAPPGDGDILVPQRNLSIIGTTEWITDDPDGSAFRREDLPFLTRRGTELVPAFEEAAFHAAWSAPRPLFGGFLRDGGSNNGDENFTGSGVGAGPRGISRDFACIDHGKEGLRGFFSILGGKATVLRAMAEKSADAICASLGLNIPCETAKRALPDWGDYYRNSYREGP